MLVRGGEGREAVYPRARGLTHLVERARAVSHSRGPCVAWVSSSRIPLPDSHQLAKLKW